MTEIPDDNRDQSEELDQLQPDDSLVDRGVDDVLDEGYSPPEKWSTAQDHGTTHREQPEGETLDERLTQEEPERATDDVTLRTSTMSKSATSEPGASPNRTSFGYGGRRHPTWKRPTSASTAPVQAQRRRPSTSSTRKQLGLAVDAGRGPVRDARVSSRRSELVADDLSGASASGPGPDDQSGDQDDDRYRRQGESRRSVNP